jgi:hypothetical protein
MWKIRQLKMVFLMNRCLICGLRGWVAMTVYVWVGICLLEGESLNLCSLYMVIVVGPIGTSLWIFLFSSKLQIANFCSKFQKSFS